MVSLAAAARSCGAERQALRDWVLRYNAQGLEGLKDRLEAGTHAAASRR